MDIQGIKKLYRVPIGRLFSPLHKAIIVNSYGRSGSTLLAKSVFSSLTNKRYGFFYDFLQRSIIQPKWNLGGSHIRKGFIYKSHDYPPEELFDMNATLVIYVFSDPVDVVLSLIRIYKRSSNHRWMRRHFKHLRAPYVDDFYNIMYHDTLGLEKHFDAWLKQKALRVAFVRYEKLWELSTLLTDFLEIDLKLFPYKERKAMENVDPGIIQVLAKTYASLRSKVLGCDDFFMVN